MPISVSCPHCRKGFKIKEEFAGKQVKCPVCQTGLTIPGGASARRRARDDQLPRLPHRDRDEEEPRLLERYEDEEDDRRDDDPRRRSSSSWAGVSAACTWVLIEQIIWLAVVVISVLVGFMEARSDPLRQRSDPTSWIVPAVLLILVARALGIVGRVLARSAPDKTAASAAGVSLTMAIVNAGLLALFVLLTLYVVTSRAPAGAEAFVVVWLACVAGALIFGPMADVFFARVLMRTGSVLDAPGLRGWGLTLFVACCVVLALSLVLLLIFISVFPPEGPHELEEAGVPILFLLTLVAWAVCAGLYIAPLAVAKGAIARAGGRRALGRHRGRRSWADVDAEEDRDQSDNHHERLERRGEMD
jgi:hypothetical protein